MTDDVAALVLRNNYLQTLALSLAERARLEDLGFQQRLMQTLEARGQLDRAVESLPDDMRARRAPPPRAAADAAGARGAAGLRQARRSTHDLLDSTVPDDPYLGRELGRYFPQAARGAFPDALEHHRLRREIIATAARQLDDQPRRAVAGRAHRRPDRRVAAARSRAPSRRCATATT